ncbi:MAG: hypothetical protein AUH25_02265 [Thaumarchaeota archaeon 13_1_40CM_38_12]|nr:MAG: hypothetical protein AUH25_02265 [Thaumarchaeota archaeon 13_1_40CM_38_12]OLC34321.1 MAG: hypothetical protein AUH84_05215 [Thaumarchaeota archaeon 13_1_40CM_4_38_7]
MTLDHRYYFDGNEKKISWIIDNIQTRSEQTRDHAEYYFDKVSVEQSKIQLGISYQLIEPDENRAKILSSS